jgi:hypothetical protein
MSSNDRCPSEGEHPNFARYREANRLDHVLYPVDIGHHRDPLERGEVLHAHLRVLPGGTTGVALELIPDDIEQPHLPVFGELSLDGRNQDGLVVLGGDFAACSEAEHSLGKVGHHFDHGGSFQGNAPVASGAKYGMMAPAS